MTMTSYLKPFFWTNPVIYSLPQDKQAILNSPVPIIAGVLMARITFERDHYSYLKEYDNLVIVYLDEEPYRKLPKVVCSPNIYREFIPPGFDEKLQELKDEYFDFHLMAKVYKPGLELTYDKHIEIGFNIAILIRKILEDRIVDCLPAAPNKRGGTEIEMPFLQNELMKKNELDDLFFYQLTQTQAFNHFLHKHYSKKTQTK